MVSQGKKMAVLDQLRLEQEAISLKGLLEKLVPEYAERSVRRWLSELVKEGIVEKLGEKRGTKYKINDYPRDYTKCFGAESQKILEHVHRPLYERHPIAYAYKWFDSYRPNHTAYISDNIRSQLHKTGKRTQHEEPAGTYAHQIFNRLLIDLSYNSSRLEGNTYSLLDTKRLLLEGTGVEGKLDEEKVMILNHKEAIRYLVDSAPKLEVSKQTICTVHYLLSDGLVENRYAGKVRDHGVHIGGSTYIPIENPKKLESQLERIAQIAALIENPYEQSLFLLVHISYLQGFSDVNKRTARLCANIPLIKNNIVPLSFNDVKQEDYMSAIIAIYELQEITPLLDLYIFSYMRTCAMYDATIKAIGFDEIRVRYRQQRRALIREILLQKMIGETMKKYIDSKTIQNIKEEDRKAFIEDVLEDLKEIDQTRIIGLGITPDQLNAWKEVSSES